MFRRGLVYVGRSLSPASFLRGEDARHHLFWLANDLHANLLASISKIGGQFFTEFKQLLRRVAANVVIPVCLRLSISTSRSFWMRPAV